MNVLEQTIASLEARIEHALHVRQMLLDHASVFEEDNGFADHLGIPYDWLCDMARQYRRRADDMLREAEVGQALLEHMRHDHPHDMLLQLVMQQRARWN